MEQLVYKVMVLVPVASGHVNPICGLVTELCQKHKMQVIFYSFDKYQQQIEKTGAEYRKFDYWMAKPTSFSVKINRFGFDLILEKMMEISVKLIPQLLRDVETDQPDLIIFDSVFLPAKLLIEILKTRHSNGTLKTRLPKNVMFAAQFPFDGKMIQSIRENTREPVIKPLVEAFMRQILFSWKYGISVFDPVKIFMRWSEHLNIVGVISDLQPYREDFDDTFKFVGSCISEETRKFDLDDDPQLKQILAKHDSKLNNHSKLIYMSLGTVFNENPFIYETVINEIKDYDQRANRNFKSDQFDVIISVGDKCFDENIQTLNTNIILRPQVPQLEVLKRSDVFITHCGMNSTNEAIKYGVPIIAIPLEADQPMVARRTCDQLKLGIRFDPFKLDGKEVGDAIDRILSGTEFRENMRSMSKISAKYNGAVDAAKLVVDFISSSN